MIRLGKNIAALLLVIQFTGCVSFKTQQLYTGETIVLPKEPVKDINLIVETKIFRDDPTDVWGLEKNKCQNNSLNKEVFFVGNKAIELNWNRGNEGCNWAGIGIGWDRYAGKDISEIMDYAAIQFYVRTTKGTMFALPFVLTLEDYSGNMGFCYTANKYFERSRIDEEWQKVVVPLADFDVKLEGLDLTNIKQLMFELQQSGSVIIDNIELVFYEPTPIQVYMVEEERPDPLKFPIVLFDDAFINNNGWGFAENKCQKIELSTQTAFDSRNSIFVTWDHDANQCAVNSFGVSWNRWFPTDITPALKTGAIQFMFNGNKSLLRNISIQFEDYDRRTSSVRLNDGYVDSSMNLNNWFLVQVPLSDFPKNTADLKTIKQLQFVFSGKGIGHIDQIKLVDVGAVF
ncbi:MAG: hypothetical protein ACXITV_10915 [Luteibaculaceae bacterium]